jgi:hypothetical protein
VVYPLKIPVLSISHAIYIPRKRVDFWVVKIQILDEEGPGKNGMGLGECMNAKKMTPR